MRSVVTRMLLITLVIALAAVAATAWLTNRETSRSVRDAVEADLEVEDAVYEALSFYALRTGTWDGVDDEVAELARRYDERIALTTLDGELIADSASSHDGPSPLPDTPVGYIAPDSPVIRLDPTDIAFEGLDVIIREGTALAEALDEAGVEFSIEDLGFGIGYPVWTEGDPRAGMVLEQFVAEWLGGGFGGAAPGEIRDGLGDLRLGLAEHLEDRGIGFDLGIGELDGVPFLEWDESDPAAAAAVEEFFGDLPGGGDLLGDFLPFTVAAEPAEPALLFLGLPAEEGALPDPVGWRLVIVVALVAVVALAATLLFGRRILAPIGALTGAARRMESGDLAERVQVRGRDEFAELAGAFNAMAASLEEQDRLRRAMAADVAHELRTPLSNIRGYLEALQEGVAEPTPEVLDSLHEEAMHLQHLIDDLQVLSLAEAGELRMDLERADLGALAAQAVAAHQPAAEAAGVTLVSDAAAGAFAEVDRSRMRQVVANLVDNALRHTPEGGSIRVAVHSRDARVVLEVADTGPGIPPEHLPHVFDRFYRADPSRSRETGGSGLGLSIARELMRAQRGDLAVAPGAGGGTVFTGWLPVAPPDPPG